MTIQNFFEKKNFFLTDRYATCADGGYRSKFIENTKSPSYLMGDACTLKSKFRNKRSTTQFRLNSRFCYASSSLLHAKRRDVQIDV